MPASNPPTTPLSWFQNLFPETEEVVVGLSKDGVIHHCSPSILEALGYSAEDVVGRRVETFAHPEDAASVRTRLSARAAAPEETLRKDVRIRDASGRFRRFRCYARWTRTDETEADIVVVARDLTPETEATDERDRAVALLEATLEATNNAILVVDHKARVQHYNTRFLSMWGFEAAELEACTPEERIRHVRSQSVERDAFESEVARIYASDAEVTRGELRLTDGRIIEFTSVPHLLDGESVGRVWSYYDVTERHTAITQSAEAQKGEALMRLAGGVAHDFNNALTAIRGCADLLELEGDDPAAREENLDELRGLVDTSIFITQQLLAFSRQQASRPQRLNVAKSVRMMERLLDRMVGPEIEILVDAAPSRAEAILDPAQMQQILMNLALNARDAMPSGGVLQVGVRELDLDERMMALHPAARPGSYVLVEVRDTGHGMPPDVLERIFDPFFTTKSDERGTGLGLSSVKGIVEEAGGFIRVESVPSIATAFYIYLPRAADEGPAARGEGKHGHGTETILLVEDDEAIRALISRMLGRYGYTVLHARNGAQAARIAERRDSAIHLLLTDVVMPEVGGRRLADQMLEHRPNLQVLFISGFTGNERVREIIDDRQFFFLAKPFDVSRLPMLVRDILDKRRRSSPPEQKAPGRT
jgi:PAS domain S-box-containing protein